MRQNEELAFGFERLDVYQRAIDRRAAMSVPINVAEATGRSSPADQRRHHAIARGSAMECAAILDACRVLGLASPDGLKEGRGLLIRVVSMLTKMCR